MTYGWASELLVMILAFIDSLVYGMIGTILNVINSISQTSIGATVLSGFVNRIYVVLGIYMVFKLAFSMLNGIVNPDKLFDKQAGMQKIIIRVITSFALLLMVPTIFEFALDVQKHILVALPQVIIEPGANPYNENIGENIANTILGSFVSVNKSCSEYVNVEEEGVTISNITDIVVQKCEHTDNRGKKIFKYSYMAVISTVIGAVLVIFLVLVCVDVGIRVIKFSILQIVAPIPILSYIDPKSEKDGAFGNWIKECINTYISLFIQLGVIYIIVSLLSTISTSFFTGGGSLITYNGADKYILWVFIFICIGAFFFMRQAPKYLMKVLGIKDGASLGIGIGAGLAGMGTLLAGGGILGAGFAIGKSLNEGATANAEGKSALTGAFGKGRDIAAQISSGNPDAKARTVGDRMKDWTAAYALSRHGITQGSLDREEENIKQMHELLSAKQQEVTNLNKLQNMHESRANIDSQINYFNSLGTSITAEQKSQRDNLMAQRHAVDDQINKLSNDLVASGSYTYNDLTVNNMDKTISSANELIRAGQENVSDSQSKYSDAKGKYKATMGPKPVGFGDHNPSNMFK